MKPSFDEIEEVFAPIADAVSDFAVSHAMRLEKCARGNTGWELVREHADGGKVFLLMLYDRNLGLGVGSVWQFPCPEMSLLYSHFRQLRPCAITRESVCTMLDEELESISSLRFGYWTHIKPLQQTDDL